MMGGKPHVIISEAEVVAALNQNDTGHRIELGRQPRLAAEAIDLAHRHLDGEINFA